MYPYCPPLLLMVRSCRVTVKTEKVAVLILEHFWEIWAHLLEVSVG